MMMMRNMRRLFCTNKTQPGVKLMEEFVSKAEEVENSDQQKQILLQERVKQLQLIHQQTQELIDGKIKLPVKLCGTSDNYQSRYAYLPNRIMSYYRIPSARITDYLLKVFKASLYSIADRNTDYMKQYWEDGFMQNTLAAIDEASTKNFKIKVQQVSNYLDEIPENCEIIDSIMFRGLSLNRKQNMHPKQYIRFSEADEVGLVTYTPKKITQNNDNFINPNKNKNVYEGYDKMMLRVLVRIKTPLRLNIPDFKIPNDVHTWEHLCVMENQMSPLKPMQSSYKLETLMQWLSKYRFGPWRVVDIDNFMEGNSPFRDYQQKNVELDPIFKNTKLDKSHHIDIRMI